MPHAEIRISDANAAVSAFGALSKLSGMTRLPADQSEFSSRLSRMSGRARPLAVALNRYVEKNGFDTFCSAFGKDRGTTVPCVDVQRRDAEAAATVSVINFDALDRTAITFAASGLY
jgi:hypothetical protein